MRVPPSLTRAGTDYGELKDWILGNTELFSEFKHARLLLTGATGWFGVWLLDSFCLADDLFGLGIRIVAVSRDPERFLRRFACFATDERIKWLKSDVRELTVFPRPFEYVIHAATDTAAPGAAPETHLQLFESILDGTRRVVESAGLQSRGILYVSSGAIYGLSRDGCPSFIEGQVGAQDPLFAGGAYAEGKRAAETYCGLAAKSGVPVTIARCFAFVGPRMPFDGHFAVGNFIADAVSGRPICVKSDGRPLRSYLYMTDLLGALLTILCRGVSGRAYNVGSDFAISIEELARCVDRVAGGCGVVIHGAPSRSNDRYVPDTSRLRTELGWRQHVDLDTAIIRTAQWYQTAYQKN